MSSRSRFCRLDSESASLCFKSFNISFGLRGKGTETVGVSSCGKGGEFLVAQLADSRAALKLAHKANRFVVFNLLLLDLGYKAGRFKSGLAKVCVLKGQPFGAFGALAKVVGFPTGERIGSGQHRKDCAVDYCAARHCAFLSSARVATPRQPFLGSRQLRPATNVQRAYCSQAWAYLPWLVKVTKVDPQVARWPY